MLDPAVLLAFVPAVLAIVVSPGPDSIYTLTRSLSGGRAAGVVASLGTATGVLVHTTAAIVGLSAILQTTTEAYLVVKYVGAGYLVYLGVQLVRNDETFELEDGPVSQDQSLGKSYRNAVVINVSNPQVAVFVLAFFPQFVPPSANATLQLSLLGVIYAGLSLFYLVVVALFASRVRHLLLDSTLNRRLLQYVSGSVLVGFALKLALEERPTA